MFAYLQKKEGGGQDLSPCPGGSGTNTLTYLLTCTITSHATRVEGLLSTRTVGISNSSSLKQPHRLRAGTHTSSVSSFASTRLLILVLSRARDVKRREAVRSTWGTTDPADARVLFVVSTNNTRSMSSGVASVDVSGDVVHVPGEEDYWQISWKVLLALEWALGAADFDYVLKTDDDSYVCVPGLLRWLTAHGSTELLYGGSPLMQRCAARQDLPLLRQLAADLYRARSGCRHRVVYPRVMHGSGYVLSRALARHVVAAALSARPQMLAAALDARDGDGGRGGAGEDVTIGALLRWWNASRVVSASFRSQKWLRMGRRNPEAVRGDCADHRQLLVHGLGTAELMRACAEGTARRNSGDGCSYPRLGTS